MEELAFRINVEGTKAVAEARKLNSFLIYASTDCVFDGRRWMYRESDETNPCDCIARTCVIRG